MKLLLTVSVVVCLFVTPVKAGSWEIDIVDTLGDSEMSASQIKEMLYRDFGYEVDISGGSGRTKTDPIIVNAATLQHASHLELLVLRGLARGQGAYWRLLETNLTEVDGRVLVQRKIETKLLHPEKIISQTKNFYFDRAQNQVSAGQIINLDIAHTDEVIGIAFPSEIGWLHFEKVIDFEHRQPGLGYSLAYNAPGFKATVYVYPILKRDPAHAAEVQSAIAEYTMAYGEDAIEHDWGISTAEDHSFFYFIPRKDPSDVSGVTVIKRGDHFIKSRVTFYDDPAIREFSQTFNSELLELVRASLHSGVGIKH
tara:strand:+ start:152 stop:1084 length:933 start_codon:yes stop_codon:yes gene_type:complete